MIRYLDVLCLESDHSGDLSDKELVEVCLFGDMLGLSIGWCLKSIICGFIRWCFWSVQPRSPLAVATPYMIVCLLGML